MADGAKYHLINGNGGIFTDLKSQFSPFKTRGKFTKGLAYGFLILFVGYTLFLAFAPPSADSASPWFFNVFYGGSSTTTVPTPDLTSIPSSVHVPGGEPHRSPNRSPNLEPDKHSNRSHVSQSDAALQYSSSPPPPVSTDKVAEQLVSEAPNLDIIPGSVSNLAANATKETAPRSDSLVEGFPGDSDEEPAAEEIANGNPSSSDSKSPAEELTVEEALKSNFTTSLTKKPDNRDFAAAPSPPQHSTAPPPSPQQASAATNPPSRTYSAPPPPPQQVSAATNPPSQTYSAPPPPPQQASTSPPPSQSSTAPRPPQISATATPIQTPSTATPTQTPSTATPTPTRTSSTATHQSSTFPTPPQLSTAVPTPAHPSPTPPTPPSSSLPSWVESLVNCDFYDGNWVRDDSYPLYKPGSCELIDEQFNCIPNGRLDTDFPKMKWKPKACSLPRLNARYMIKLLRGKRLVFVGDSLNRNMWESLICILRTAVKNLRNVYEASGRVRFRTEAFYSFVFKDYNFTIDFYVSPFLVRQWEMRGNGTKRDTLRIDMMGETANSFKNADILVFNTGHWWTHEKTSKGQDYYQEGTHLYHDLNVKEAYRRAMTTWARWVDANIDPSRTHVLFRGYSNSHFSGGQWNSGGACDNETEPITNDAYLTEYPWKMTVLESVFQGMKTKVSYLNITRLTDYRKDGHPSIYRKKMITEEERQSPLKYQDCSHWCLPGVPDAWNELLYAEMLVKQYKDEQSQRYNT